MVFLSSYFVLCSPCFYLRFTCFPHSIVSQNCFSYFKASALTSLEALQSLLQRILELDKYGFKAHFLDMDGRSFLNSRWSIREIGYLFNWDRRSVLTIWFTLQVLPVFLALTVRYSQ